MSLSKVGQSVVDTPSRPNGPERSASPLGSPPSTDQAKALLFRASALTEIQRKMICARASGQTRKEIAYSFGLSLKTVDYHFSKLYRCLEIADDIELTHFAIRAGMIEVKTFAPDELRCDE